MAAEELQMVLHALALHGPVTLGGLALVLGKERNRVAQAVEQLVADGLVRRERTAAGPRIVLQLTPEGRQALADGGDAPFLQ